MPEALPARITKGIRKWRPRTRQCRLALVVLVYQLISPLHALPALAANHPVTDETGRKIDVPDRPERLVSLAPSVTETLYALGLGDKIVGDTDYCDYPTEASRKPHVGAVLNPSVERIVALRPDLVIGSAEANRRETAEQLARLGIPLYGVSDHAMIDVLKSIRDLGALLGCRDRAEALATGLEQRIRTVEKRVAAAPKPRVLFVTWYEPLITVGRRNFIADVIRRAGGTPITDDLSGEWPRLSLEAVLERDPDVILVPQSQSFSPTLDKFRQLPGWRDLRAVKAGKVYWVPDTIIHPSPRLVDALEAVARVLHPPANALRAAEAR
jgi:ABC-type Fe3+-hydroxamate transport system substrate-binding protein